MCSAGQMDEVALVDDGGNCRQTLEDDVLAAYDGDVPMMHFDLFQDGKQRRGGDTEVQGR